MRSTASNAAPRAYRLGVAAAASILAAPSLASACAVCGASQSRENQVAYLVTTGFLTFLPLILVGLVVMWIRARVRALEGEAIVPEPGSEFAPPPRD